MSCLTAVAYLGVCAAIACRISALAATKAGRTACGMLGRFIPIHFHAAIQFLPSAQASMASSGISGTAGPSCTSPVSGSTARADAGVGGALLPAKASSDLAALLGAGVGAAVSSSASNHSAGVLMPSRRLA